ncbi:MAG: hypothetical protein ABIQ88_18705 [Chitinophagaceae bacterium]
MKPRQLLLIALLYGITGNGFCQEAKSKVYEIRNNIAVYPADITGKKLYQDGRFSTPPLGAKFMLVRRLKDDTLLIRYLLWTGKKDSVLRKYYNDPLIIDSWDIKDMASEDGQRNETKEKSRWPLKRPVDKKPANTGDSAGTAVTKEDYDNKIDKYFMIQQYDLDSNCVKVYNAGFRSSVFTIGLVTMPLKLRLGSNFDFQGNLSLGTTAGVKIRLSRFSANYVNVLLGTAISTISLDSFNTRGKVAGQPISNMAVFSPSLGVVFEFGRAQAGLFYGWDILNKSTQTKYEWIYNRKPWLSIGFGFSIFNVDGSAKSAEPKNQ